MGRLLNSMFANACINMDNIFLASIASKVLEMLLHVLPKPPKQLPSCIPRDSS